MLATLAEIQKMERDGKARKEGDYLGRMIVRERGFTKKIIVWNLELVAIRYSHAKCRRWNVPLGPKTNQRMLVLM